MLHRARSWSSLKSAATWPVGDGGEIGAAWPAWKNRRSELPWLRQFPRDAPGYGYVDEDIPELSMAVLPTYRGRGVGTALLEAALTYSERRYAAVSLSVDPRNPAVRLYRRKVFKPVGQSGTSLVMLRTFEGD